MGPAEPSKALCSYHRLQSGLDNITKYTLQPVCGGCECVLCEQILYTVKLSCSFPACILYPLSWHARASRLYTRVSQLRKIAAVLKVLVHSQLPYTGTLTSSSLFYPLSCGPARMEVTPFCAGVTPVSFFGSAVRSCCPCLSKCFRTAGSNV